MNSESDDYVGSVRDFLSAQGWECSDSKIDEGAYLIQAKQNSGGEAQFMTAMVITDAETQIRKQHLKHLIKSGNESNSDKMFLTSTLEINQNVRNIAENYDIEIIDKDKILQLYGDDSSGDQGGVDGESSSKKGRLSGFSIKMAVTATVLGVVIGGFLAWATANLGISGISFVIGFVGGSYYLYQKPIPSSAIGSGLYITSLIMIITPISFYLPVVFGEGSQGGIEGAGAFAGGILGLLIWGFVFAIFAIVTAAIGYFSNKRAAKKLSKN